MATKRPVLALIGKGKWGQNYINTISGMSECILPPENIKTLNYPELFSYKGVDGVIIASPTVTHYPIAKACIEHGLNILIENRLLKHILKL